MLNLLLWLFMGALVGWIASLVMSTGRDSTLVNIVVGVVGAAVGGFLFRSFGSSGSNINEVFSVYSVLVSVVGAVVVLGVIQLLRRGRSR